MKTPEEKRKEATERMRQWRALNPERSRASLCKWRSENTDRVRALYRAAAVRYRERNPIKIREMNRVSASKWRARHGADANAYKAHHCGRRRVAKKANGGTHTLAEWVDRCDSFRNVCAYCGAGGKLTRDHVVPVSRGGTDDIANIVPACQSCNSSKCNKTADEYLGEAA